MPIPAEVDAFQREICRDQRVVFFVLTPPGLQSQQSSPIPVTIAGFLRTLAVRRIWAINAFSPITTATTISESAGPSQSESGFQSYWMADAWTSMSDGLGAKSVVRRPLRNASGVAAITQLK